MSCTGCNDGCFDESVQLAQGPTGNVGTNGSNGLYGGWSLKWKFDDNTGSGTGSNEIRLNNVDPQAANVIYVNDDAYGTGAADVFLSSVTSAPFGKIKIFKEYDSTVFWLATITAADDTTVPAEVKFTVTDVVTNGSFTDGDDIVLTLAPAGAAGATGGTGVGTPGTDGVAVLDYRTADGGPFAGGVLYYPGIVQAAFSNLAVVQDASANNLQTTIPSNTLQNVGDFLRVKLVVAIQSPTLSSKSLGAMQFSVWWDTILIGSFNVGSLAMNAVGSQGFEAIIDVAMVDNTLITTGNVQISANIKWFDESTVGIANVLAVNLYDGVAKGVTINETLSNPHTIYVKAINPESNTSNATIIDLEESAGRFSNDAGYVLAYEVIKYKKQV
jgi:hypothetical protein